MKIIRKSPKRIYAYKTQVSKTKTLEDIRTLLDKFNCKGFQYTEDPYNNTKYIRFFIITKDFGDLPIQIDIPEVIYKMKSGKEKYLEAESYRLLLLIIKTKVTLIQEIGEPPEVAFLPYLLRKNGKTIIQTLIDQKELPKLMEEN